MSLAYSRDDLRERLDIGYVWQWRVGMMLGLEGFTVKISGYDLRGEYESPDRFRSEVDISLSLPGTAEEHIEVKSKGGRHDVFTSPSDWPYSNVTCYATRKGRNDIPVLLACQKTKAVVGLLDDGSTRWKSTQRDDARGGAYEVWTAPKSLLLPLPEWCSRMRHRLKTRTR